jgi:hypothetical protein
MAEVTTERALKVLEELSNDSATGPDNLPTRILKECAKQLAAPFCMLAKIVLQERRWPDAFLVHNIVPLHKKNSVYHPTNYRGVHLTAQLSKAMERLLQTLFMPFLLRSEAFGPNQFAYTPERGARDALAHMLLAWLPALAKGKKIGAYCSDVSGAFDRVKVERLVAKLKAKKIHPVLVEVIMSWLRDRSAQVVIGGERSGEFELKDMVFQGTVWGPTLWNVFFEDARRAINEMFFVETVYADDLNAYRIFESTTSNADVLKSTTMCQAELHSWGGANQVAFDPKKESLHVLSKTEGYGPEFKILGVLFDSGLTMASAVAELVTEASWKLKMLIKTRRYYNDAELVMLYKSQLLSFLEYRTPALYHATRNVLERLDNVQSRFLRDAGIDDTVALLEFNLAPLATRRDIAMLGVIHRAVLGKGPPHFKQYFRINHDMQLHDPRTTNRSQLVTRSALGLIAVYNLLPAGITSARSVTIFQTRLQLELKLRAEAGLPTWQNTYSPRMPLHQHPLRQDDGSKALIARVLEGFFDSSSGDEGHM